MSDDKAQLSTSEKNLYPADTIAKLFGVSVRRVQQLTQEGIITTTKPSKGRRGYELIPTVRGYISYLQDRVRGRAATDEEEKLKNQKLQADINLKESQYELHRLKTDIENGKYIKIEDVKTDYKRFFAQFKKFAQAVPARLITQVSGYLEPVEARALEKNMTQEVAVMLRSFVVAGGGSAGEKR